MLDYDKNFKTKKKKPYLCNIKKSNKIHQGSINVFFLSINNSQECQNPNLAIKTEYSSSVCSSELR